MTIGTKFLIIFGQLLIALVFLASPGYSQQQKSETDSLPHLQKTDSITQLYVDGKPFLALGGELGNSTASDLKVLDAALEKCQKMNLNTIMLPVYWNLIEPKEGEFDFSLVKGAIDIARARNLRLVYLWFGTWKNSMSCYAPGWVKRDTTRFERVKQANGEIEEIISPESTAANEADIRAFAALMQWTKNYDAQKHTVIMVQVENEIGMIPDPRDHSNASDRAYKGEVPQKLLSLAAAGQLGPEVNALWEKAGSKNKGSWSEVFGADPWGEEVFSAWQFSTYVEKVVTAGKKEYPLPMFANAALIRPNYKPGQYPSAGPLPHLLEVWRAGAPSLDMLSPDIYFPSFMEWCGKYVRNGNPLFIPEMANTKRAPGNLLYAFAKFNAMGTGPFSIENSDPEKQEQITAIYKLLAGMSDLILKAQRDKNILGLSPQIAVDWAFEDKPQKGELGGVVFEAKFDHAQTEGNSQTTALPTLGSGRWEAPPGVPFGSAMIIQLGNDEFLITGMGVVVTFSPTDGKGKIGIDRVQEGQYDRNGAWVGGRWLDGDETHQGRHVHLYDGHWTIQRVTLYRY